MSTIRGSKKQQKKRSRARRVRVGTPDPRLTSARCRGFDEVGQADPQVHPSITKVLEYCAWPGQVMEPEHGDPEGVTFERDELVLDDERDSLVRGVEDPVFGGNTPPVAAQHELLGFAARLACLLDGRTHGRGPLGTVD